MGAYSSTAATISCNAIHHVVGRNHVLKNAENFMWSATCVPIPARRATRLPA